MKYLVSVEETTFGDVIVEANSKSEAEDKALGGCDIAWFDETNFHVTQIEEVDDNDAPADEVARDNALAMESQNAQEREE